MVIFVVGLAVRVETGGKTENSQKKSKDQERSLSYFPETCYAFLTKGW